MKWLTEDIRFPPHSEASPSGMIALGGDLSVSRLIAAYQQGIFPWYCEGEPIVWYSPPERMVLVPNEVKVSKSMKKVLDSGVFRITENTQFETVIHQCKHIQRADGYDTWITEEMKAAYIALHKNGYARSIEVWQDEALVGGLYGIELGTVFCGESMFSKVSNASKAAFIYLAQQKNYQLIDCQVYNDHLASLGAKEIPRSQFLNYLQ